jgi:hypothetical protein
MSLNTTTIPYYTIPCIFTTKVPSFMAILGMVYLDEILQHYIIKTKQDIVDFDMLSSLYNEK